LEGQQGGKKKARKPLLGEGPIQEDNQIKHH